MRLPHWAPLHLLRLTAVLQALALRLLRVNQCTMEEAMTVISLVQADLNASFVNKQRAPQ